MSYCEWGRKFPVPRKSAYPSDAMKKVFFRRLTYRFAY